LDLAMGSGLVGSLGLAGSLEMGLGLGTSILEALAHSRPSS
jgi:isocitrate/isopropylmalate dehydrogenase